MGYALGAVVAAYLVQRFKQRLLFLLTEAVFVVATVLAATAPGAGAYVTGRTLQGAATGLMLVLALPPFVTRFGAGRLPRTAALVNVGLFGAVTVGPLAGGIAALTNEGFRGLFGVVAAAGAAGLTLAWLTLPHQPPFDPDTRPDWSAFALAGIGTVLPFFAVTRLTSLPVTSPLVWAPLAVGVAALVLLIVRQYRRPDALMPVKALSTSLPVIGTSVAMVAGAATVTFLELTVVSLLEGQQLRPMAAGALLSPMVAGLAVAALLFARLLATRWAPALVLAGLTAVGAGGVLLLEPSDHLRVALGAAVLGFGAGATVSPGLFLAAFGVESTKIGRAFALVELLRSEAAYLVGPVLLYVAMSQATAVAGFTLAMGIGIAVVGFGIVMMLVLYLAGGVRPRPPDLDGWLRGDGLALHSPPTAERARTAVAIH